MPFIGLYKPPLQEMALGLKVGDNAPTEFSRDKPCVVAFLRHSGCPFAEALLKNMSQAAHTHPEMAFHVVCHGEAKYTNIWLNKFALSPALSVQVDEERKEYGKWGLGYIPPSHFLHPGMIVNIVTLFFKGIRNRQAAGTRWQMHALFGVGANQKIALVSLPNHVGDLLAVDEAIRILEVERNR